MTQTDYVEVQGRIVVQRRLLDEIDTADDPRTQREMEDALVILLGRRALADLRAQRQAARPYEFRLVGVASGGGP